MRSATVRRVGCCASGVGVGFGLSAEDPTDLSPASAGRPGRTAGPDRADDGADDLCTECHVLALPPRGVRDRHRLVAPLRRHCLHQGQAGPTTTIPGRPPNESPAPDSQRAPVLAGLGPIWGSVHPMRVLAPVAGADRGRWAVGSAPVSGVCTWNGGHGAGYRPIWHRSRCKPPCRVQS